MKLQFLGSAAAEGWPAMFCECPACKEAARRGGRDLRLRTGSIVDDEVLIDFTPDLMSQKIKFNLPLEKVRDCFLTHTHEDHFEPRNMFCFANGYATIYDRAERPMFHFYGSEKSRPAFEHSMFDENKGTRDICDYTVLKLYERFELNGRGYTPIPAVHGCVGAVNYIIDEDGKTIIYAHDTGIWQDEVFEFLKGIKLDLITMDCCNGPLKVDYTGHMGFEQNIYVRDRLLRQGTADEHTRFIINHFSHNCGMLYDEMVLEMTPKGFEVGFDGKIMEL